MDHLNKPETEADAVLVQDRRRYRALQSLQAQQGQTPAFTQKRQQVDEEDE
jgi:hypothetical protein